MITTKLELDQDEQTQVIRTIEAEARQNDDGPRLSSARARKRTALGWLLLVLGASALLTVALSGCKTISLQASNEISANVAVGVGNLKDWGNLTDDMRHQAYWKLVRATVNWDQNVNGRAIPDEFKVDPWAAGGPHALPLTQPGPVK